MSVLFALGLFISRLYYQSVNESVDPRIKPARELYKGYNELATSGDYETLFLLLDSIKSVYTLYPHYKESYEIGVLYNNKAAAYLTMAMFKDSISIPSKYFGALPKDTLLKKASNSLAQSISIYENWIHLYKNKSKSEIEMLIPSDFNIGLEDYSSEERELYLQNRIDELLTAQVETPRRLSVSYSNMGLIFRNFGEYEQAAEYYQKAITLWDENLEARNNLNRLLGKPLEKRNFIQKLFPKDGDN